ncbi:hypothetical protein, partial [uncultured Desulfovibrio sp.]|uniref:hypothetical protein n=1 Tax=uncultured Desulfovibrio sp. TaxID=167968 RepID=UPI002610124B
MKRFCLFPLAAALLFGQTGYAVAMDYLPRDNKFMSFLYSLGFDSPRECVRMADHVPPLPPEADKIFKAARALEKRGDLTLREKGQVFEGYKKAAEMGHWKAMNSLIACYRSTSAG